MILVVRPGLFTHPGSRIQGSKRHPIQDPGSGFATLLITVAQERVTGKRERIYP